MTEKLRQAAQFALDAMQCPGDSELMERAEQKLREALADNPEDEENLYDLALRSDNWEQP